MLNNPECSKRCKTSQFSDTMEDIVEKRRLRGDGEQTAEGIPAQFGNFGKNGGRTVRACMACLGWRRDFLGNTTFPGGIVQRRSLEL
jgi:hypothetical protein